jgi:hypothetical protein
LVNNLEADFALSLSAQSGDNKASLLLAFFPQRIFDLAQHLGSSGE